MGRKRLPETPFSEKVMTKLKSLLEQAAAKAKSLKTSRSASITPRRRNTGLGLIALAVALLFAFTSCGGNIDPSAPTVSSTESDNERADDTATDLPNDDSKPASDAVDQPDAPRQDAAPPAQQVDDSNDSTATNDVQDLLNELGYTKERGFTTNIDDKARADIADNNAGAWPVGDSNPVTAEEAAAVFTNNPTVGGSYAQKSNPNNWVLVYSPECFVYDDMWYKAPNGQYGSAGGFVECGVAEWLNIPALREGIMNARARLRCENGVNATPRPTTLQPTFPEVAPEPKLVTPMPKPEKPEEPVKQHVVKTITKKMYPHPQKTIVVKECECISIPEIVIEDCPEQPVKPEKPTPSATPTPSDTPSGAAPSPTPTPSETPAEEPTEEPSPGPTPTPSETPSEEPSEEPTEEPTPTPTPTPTEPDECVEPKGGTKCGPGEEPEMIEVCLDITTGETGMVPDFDADKYPTPVENCKPTEEEPTPTPTPSETPTEEPTEEPSPEPTPTPSETPSEEPSEEPTPEPTPTPTPTPTETPTEEPTPEPTPTPTEPENPVTKDPANDGIKDEGLNEAPAPDPTQGEELPEDVPAPAVPLNPETLPNAGQPVGDTIEETVIAPPTAHDPLPAAPPMSEENGNVDVDRGQIDREEQVTNPGTTTGADEVIDPNTGVVIVAPNDPIAPPAETPSLPALPDPDGNSWADQPITEPPATVVEQPAVQAPLPIVDAAPAAEPIVAEPQIEAPAPVELTPAPAPVDVPAPDLSGGELAPPAAA